MATTENWRNKLAVSHAGLATPTQIPGAAARLTSSPTGSFVRRGPAEGVVAAGPIWTARGFTLELQHTSAFWTAFLAGAIADDGSESVSGSTTTWTIGQAGAAPRRHTMLAYHESVGTEELRDAVLNTWQINVERRSAVRHLTDWRYLSSEAGSYSADETRRGLPIAGARQCQATFGEDGAPVFACAINLTRDIRPAGFRHTGTPTTYDGGTGVEITGRLLCTLTPTQSNAILAGAITLPLQVAIAHNAHTFSLAATVVCRSEGRRHLGDGLYEDDVIFAAKGPATLTLVEP